MGTSPTKFAHNFFLIFGKNSMSKKVENYFFDFGSKNYADRCNLVSRIGENGFFDQNKILKFFDFWTSKNFKKF